MDYSDYLYYLWREKNLTKVRLINFNYLLGGSMLTKYYFFRILAIFLLLNPVATMQATLNGKYRVSEYKIFDDGSFSYDVTIRVKNDLDITTEFNGNWKFYVQDVSTIHTENIEWTGEWMYFEEAAPFDPGIIRTGYTRTYKVTYNPFEEKVYRLGYSGPSGFWNFGDFDGAFYGDGTGGAETAFEFFYVDLQLPTTAQNYSILQESSAHYLLSENPFKLRWIENNVNTITCWVSFSGEDLTTDEPEIIIDNVVPSNPSIFSSITFNGRVKFPDGTSFNPGVIGLEDPLELMSKIINVNSDGTFQFNSTASNFDQEGPYLFKLFFQYNNKMVINNFILPIQNTESNYDFYLDNIYTTSAFNHTSILPSNINVYSYRTLATEPPTQADIENISGQTSVTVNSYLKATANDYWSSDVNKVVFVVTAVSCATSWTNPFSAGACVWGLKTVAVGIAKSSFFVGADKFIDELPEDQLSEYEKEQLKLDVRFGTHVATFFLMNPTGGTAGTQIASTANLAAKLTENQIQYSKLISYNTSNSQASVPDFVIQAVDENGYIWNMCIADQSQKSLIITSHSPVDLEITDALGRSISKTQSDIPGSFYFEADFNGDGDLDDQVTINNYNVGLYDIKVIPEVQSIPTDLVSLTFNAPWLDSTHFIFTDKKIEDLSNETYSVNAEIISKNCEYWVDGSDSIEFNGDYKLTTLLELPDNYSLEYVMLENVKLNDNYHPLFIDTLLYDKNLNGRSEKLITFQLDSVIINGLAEDGFVILNLSVMYDNVTQFLGSDSIYVNVTEVSEGKIFSIRDYQLLQNYPNPFNPSTLINFEIPKQSNVLLKVYDILGNEVAILINEEKIEGSYQVVFDASALSNGVYFYRLQAGDFLQTKKMILLK